MCNCYIYDTDKNPIKKNDREKVHTQNKKGTSERYAYIYRWADFSREYAMHGFWFLATIYYKTMLILSLSS